MARAGRPQGALRGATEAANELARFLMDTSDRLTVREMARRYGGGKSLWGEYRSGARIIPLGRLDAVVRDRVRDVRGRERMLARARRLHDEALAAEVARSTRPGLREALARAEADLAESARLVRTLLALVTMLQEELVRTPQPASGAAREPEAPPPERGGGTGSAVPVPDARPAPLDEAFDRLGTAWALWKSAVRTCADARARTAGSAPDAVADAGLALALARADGELELHRESVRELWSRMRADRPGGEVLEGVVLERADRAMAVPASSRESRRALPLPRAAPASPAATARAGLATFALIVLAAAVGVLAGSREVGDTAAGPAVPAPWQTAASPTASGPAPSPPSASPVLPGAGPAPSAAPPRAARAVPSGPRPSAPGGAPSPSSVPSPSATPSGPAEPGPPPLPDGLLRLTNVASRMCLSAPVGSATPAEGLVQTGCGADFEQFWRLTREGTSHGEPVYAVRNRHNGLCLSVDAARTTNDAIITQYLCGDEDGLFRDQFWVFRYDRRYHAWHLVSRNSGKCVAIRQGGGALEQALQSECAGDPWLLWRA